LHKELVVFIGCVLHFQTSYTVCVYREIEIERKLSLQRSDLIALALLLGSDYGEGGEEKGVPTVGKKKGMKLIKELKSKGLDVLKRYGISNSNFSQN